MGTDITATGQNENIFSHVRSHDNGLNLIPLTMVSSYNRVCTVISVLQVSVPEFHFQGLRSKQIVNNESDSDLKSGH